MLREYTILPVTAAAGLIAGAGPATFLAAALAATAAAWAARHLQPADLIFANLDPRNPDAATIPDALRQALDHARQTGRAVRLRMAALPPATRKPCRVTLTPKGDAEVDGPLRTVALRRPGVWLPDHPLPLYLTRARSLTLVFEPCGSNRIRVSFPPVWACRFGHWQLLALLAATACALDAGWLLAAALGFAFQSYLLQQQNGRSPDNPKVRCR